MSLRNPTALIVPIVQLALELKYLVPGPNHSLPNPTDALVPLTLSTSHPHPTNLNDCMFVEYYISHDHHVSDKVLAI